MLQDQGLRSFCPKGLFFRPSRISPHMAYQIKIRRNSMISVDLSYSIITCSWARRQGIQAQPCSFLLTKLRGKGGLIFRDRFLIVIIGQLKNRVLPWPRNLLDPFVVVRIQLLPHAERSCVIVKFWLIRRGVWALLITALKHISMLYILSPHPHRNPLTFFLGKCAMVLIIVRTRSANIMFTKIHSVAPPYGSSFFAPKTWQVIKFRWR